MTWRSTKSKSKRRLPYYRDYLTTSCDIYAENLNRERFNGKGKVLWIDDLPGHADLPVFIGHCVVKYKDKYYDMLNPEGKSDWMDLDFVKKSLDGTIVSTIESIPESPVPIRRHRSSTPYSVRELDDTSPQTFFKDAPKPNLRKSNPIEKKLNPILPSPGFESFFIGPSGKFYGVRGFHHQTLSSSIDLSPDDLQNIGFVRVFAPEDQKAVSMTLSTQPTAAQLSAIHSLETIFPSYATVIWAYPPGRWSNRDTFYSYEDFKLAL